jgi:hypothetical protein
MNGGVKAKSDLAATADVTELIQDFSGARARVKMALG